MLFLKYRIAWIPVSFERIPAARENIRGSAFYFVNWNDTEMQEKGKSYFIYLFMSYNECAVNQVPPYTLTYQTPGVWDPIMAQIASVQSIVPRQQFSQSEKFTLHLILQFAPVWSCTAVGLCLQSCLDIPVLKIPLE